MSFRSAWLASALSALAGVLAAGCGDVCGDARDHIEECGSPANPGNQDEECTGTVECAADCINDASCEAITGKNVDEANALAACLNECGPEG
jgi:hypothetical protein